MYRVQHMQLVDMIMHFHVTVALEKKPEFRKFAPKMHGGLEPLTWYGE